VNPDPETEALLQQDDYLRGALVLDGPGEALIVPVAAVDKDCENRLRARLRWNKKGNR
jgi:hypothetical protein